MMILMAKTSTTTTEDLKELDTLIAETAPELAEAVQAKKPAKSAAKTKKAAKQEETQPEVEDAETAPTPAPAKKTAKARARGKKYADKRSLVDKTKTYPLAEAVELIKRMSYTKFDGSVEAHAQVKEAGLAVTLTYPNSTGKSIKVAIVSPEVLKQIEQNNIDFDVLLAKPEDMKLLTKHARSLGPKGLMPNPKNGTLTPDPEKKKKSLEAGAITLKTEKKAPLMHTVIGKVSMPTEQLTANIETLIKSLDTKLVKLYLAGTMTPSVRVELS